MYEEYLVLANVSLRKNVGIRSYSGPHFHAFGLNTERYSVSLFIQSEIGIMRGRITPNMDTFYAVSAKKMYWPEFLMRTTYS